MISAILSVPAWIWWTAAIIGVGLLSYCFGGAYGFEQGIDHMRRQAIGAGVAKACDFDGGWRWKTWPELKERFGHQALSTSDQMEGWTFADQANGIVHVKSPSGLECWIGYMPEGSRLASSILRELVIAKLK